MENQCVSAKLKSMRPSMKKDIKYVDNNMVRRSTYSRRAKSIVVAAMELEIQTGCNVDLRIMPTWPKGKTHSYHTQPFSTANAELISAPTEPERPPLAPVQTQRIQTQRKASTNSCRICGQDADLSFWLGCGYTNPRTKRQDCKYWVHQKCIGLHYKKETDLLNVPFYCPKHGY